MYNSDKWYGDEAVVRLRTWMSENGISQAELSRRTGISQSRLSRVLRNHYEFLTDSFWIRLKKCEDLPIRWVKYGC